MPPSPFARIFAWTGAAIFAGSLVLFGVRYIVDFSVPITNASGDAWPAASIDVALFTIFALHHTLCARMGLKTMLARVVPARLERAVYVWIASGLFIAVLLCWQPVPGIAWHVTGAWQLMPIALQLAGAWITLASARRLDVLELSGVRQLDARPRTSPPVLVDDGLYRVVRHPIYFAWLLMVWPATPMTGTRLVFAAVSTLYLCLAIPFEERDLRRAFGRAYTDYARRVRSRLVPFIY